MSYSAEQCIRHNNFEYAKDKYETTTPRWKEHWWNCLVEIYNKSKEWAKKYVLNPIKKNIEEVGISIINNSDYKGKDNKEKCYLFKFFFESNEEISKVGTTKRSIHTRLQEEIRQYEKKFGNIKKVIIESVFNCDTHERAIGAESDARAKFIKEYPNTFLDNDRFMNVDIPKKQFDKYAMAYLK